MRAQLPDSQQVARKVSSTRRGTPSSIQSIVDKTDVTYLDLGSDVEESKVTGHEMVSNASSLILSNGVRCCSYFLRTDKILTRMSI